MTFRQYLNSLREWFDAEQLLELYEEARFYFAHGFTVVAAAARMRKTLSAL